ncbi:protein transporter SEC31, partial [Emergomyces africanus]
MFATASFDGRISIQTIQNTRSEASARAGVSQAQPVDDEDFFAKAQSRPQASTFSLPTPPKWLQRPASVSFGFGGRVISVGLTDPNKPGSRASKVRITPFEVDSTVSSATKSFEEALKVGDLRKICESRIESAQSDSNRADWKVIETLISDNPRKQVIKYLGFSSEVDETADTLSKLGLGKNEGEVNGVPESGDHGPGVKKHKRLSSIFGTLGESDNFLTDLSASKGARTNNPFQIYTGSESEADRGVTRALLLGDFEKALDICLQEDRMSDAFMIAICGGQKCIDKAQEAYFQKQAEGPNYLRLLASVVGKNLWDVVHNADLANWKEAIATICTFATNEEFPDLCETLGDRLEEQAKAQNDKESRKNAALCFLASSKLEKVVGIWIDELQENESKSIQEATDDTSFSIHVRALQSLIEKVTIFRHVTKFEDTEKQKPSDWKLSLLYEKYLEYADVAATHGQLDIAEKYLDLLPQTHPAAEVARNRIKLATRKPAARAASAHPATTSRLTPKPLPPQPNVPQGMFNPSASMAQANNPYAPVAPMQASNPYAPAGVSSGYTPAGYQPPQQRQAPGPVVPPPQAFGAPQQSHIPPPPRATNQSPSTGTSYTNATNLPAWNDLPEGFAKAPTPRRGTPSAGVGAISSPFPNQQPPPQPSQSPQAMSPHHPPPPKQRSSMAVPPPPRGQAGPPRMTSPPSVGQPYGFQAPERPPSTSSAYTPSSPHPPPAGPGMNVPQIPRGPSPYNAPPSGPPPSNRYAPNPAAQPSATQPPRPAMAPPPTGAPAPAPGPSPYAYQHPPPAAAQGPYAPPSAPTAGRPDAQPQHQPPPPSSAPGSRPGTAQSQRKPAAAPKY